MFTKFRQLVQMTHTDTWKHTQTQGHSDPLLQLRAQIELCLDKINYSLTFIHSHKLTCEIQGLPVI